MSALLIETRAVECNGCRRTALGALGQPLGALRDELLVTGWTRDGYRDFCPDYDTKRSSCGSLRPELGRAS